MKQNPNTSKFWDKHLSSLSRIPKEDFITKDRISNVAKLIPDKKIKLLDVGAGYGFLEQKLSKKKNINFFCLDISYTGMKRLKSKYIGEFLIASSRAITFQKEIFDYVCLLEVLEHLFEEEAFLTFSEVYRVLKPGGKFILSVPLYDEPKQDHPSGHVRMYTPDSIVSEVVKNGFEIVSSKALFAFKENYLLKKMVNKIFKMKKHPNNIIIFARKKEKIIDGG